jgi:putative NAD(P)-binding protein
VRAADASPRPCPRTACCLAPSTGSSRSCTCWSAWPRSASRRALPGRWCAHHGLRRRGWTRPSDEGREDLHVGHHKVDRAGDGGAGRSARGDRGPGEGDRGYALVLVTGGRLRIAGLWCVVIGDGRNLEDVRRAMSEQDAVISTVAQGSGRQPVHRDPRHPDRGRRDEGVRRMPAGLCQRLSSGSAGIPPWSASCAGSSRVSYADRAVAERLVQPSGLDWTIVRPTTTSISATSDTSDWPK